MHDTDRNWMDFWHIRILHGSIKNSQITIMLWFLINFSIIYLVLYHYKVIYYMFSWYLYLHLHVFHADSSCFNELQSLSLSSETGWYWVTLHNLWFSFRASTMWELWVKPHHLMGLYCYKYSRFVSLVCQNQHPRHYGPCIFFIPLFHYWCTVWEREGLRPLRPDRRWPSAWRFCSNGISGTM